MNKRKWYRRFYQQDLRDEKRFIKETRQEIKELEAAKRQKHSLLARALIGDALRKLRNDLRYYRKSIAYDKAKLKNVM